MEPDPVAESTSRVAALAKNVETIAKGGVAIVAICYALGLLIKNIYLASWSTFSAKFVEVEYVLTGALFALLVLLGVGYASFTVGVLRSVRVSRAKEAYRGQQQARFKERLKILLIVLTGLALVIGILRVISDNVLDLTEYVLALTGIFIVPGIAVLTRESIATIWHHYALRRDVPGQLGMFFFVAAALLMGILVLHSFVIYPSVAPAYGGGRHARVHLYMNEEGTRMLRQMGFVPNPNEPQIFSAELIVEDDTYLTVAAPRKQRGDRSAVRIRRDQVDLILTHRSAATNPGLFK